MEHAPAGGTADGVQRRLWVLAVVVFGVCDVASTAVGLSAGGVEANPVVGAAVAQYELVAMVPLKLAALGLSYAVWWHTPALYRSGVPIGLAGVGAAATGWNLAVLSMLLGA